MNDQQNTFRYHMPTPNRWDAEIIIGILSKHTFITAVRLYEMFDPHSGARAGFRVAREGYSENLSAFVAAVKQALRER